MGGATSATRSGLLDYFADFDALNCDRTTWRRVLPELLGPRSSCFLGFEDDYRRALVFPELDPGPANEAGGLLEARYCFLPRKVLPCSTSLTVAFTTTAFIGCLRSPLKALVRQPVSFQGRPMTARRQRQRAEA
jgi:hypothetical protein